MTKQELIKEIAKQTGIEKASAGIMIEAFMNIVHNQMLKKKAIYLRGFGTFKLKKRAEKIGRNITANKEVIIPEHFIPFFKPARVLHNAVKNIK